MRSRIIESLIIGGLLLIPALLLGQSFNTAVIGTVTDPSGAVIPGAELTLKSKDTDTVARFTTGAEGLYHFGNLARGTYALTVSAKGFRDFVQRGIVLNINETLTVNVKLEVGASEQRIEVTAEGSPLNQVDATIKQSISPTSIEQLPLAVSGNSRSAANFIILSPGVTTGGGNNPFDARINGGMEMGDEAVLDGVTMQEGLMSQSGMVALGNDFPMNPEAVQEVSILTSNYEPQYGSTTSGVITAVTKSGTNDFHGELHEYHHNNVLNARQFGAPTKPKDLENEFGGSTGGPIKIPGAWGGSRRSYFFFNYDAWYIRGGTRFPVSSIPSLQERQGDFRDWVDAEDQLIPIYDPATTRPNPSFDPNLSPGPTNLPFLRDQFMGCDGKTPNVICPSDPRLQNSLANQWLQHLPQPSFSGPRNNFISPVAISDISGLDTDHRTSIDVKVDHYLGEKDHFSAAIHYHNTVFRKSSVLPEIISGDSYLLPDGGEIGPWANRLSWDHTFSPTLLNNLNYGIMIMKGSEESVSASFADQLPQIPGVANHLAPPRIELEGFEPMGNNVFHYESRPTNVVNDLVTWVRGKHSFKFGGEMRWLQNNFRDNNNGPGTFRFASQSTGLLGLNSGNPIASFLLEQVDNADAGFVTIDALYMRAKQWNLHAGDTWKVTPKLSVTYGVRWDVALPPVEKWNNLSIFDASGANPAANNRPGRMAFAGSGSLLTGQSWGPAAFGPRHPERSWYKGIAPRLGIAYSVNDKTVVRTGYGIFYSQAFIPGWGGGSSLDGFNANPAFGSSNGGLTAAFILNQGFPQNFNRPPFIDSTFLNGQDGPLYRPLDANRLPYSQQWNLTVEREFTSNFYVSAGYVGNKGTRLLSVTAPLNALNPNLLSLGQALFDEFEPGQAELDGVPAPYGGWAEQLASCSPSVAQALVPYPQYCGALQGLNENAGNSTYHSFQFKAEKRFADGVWFLGSYTLSKLLTNADSAQSSAQQWSGAAGAISPFERQRTKSLSVSDVPQTLSVALIYDLPVGKGKRFMNHGGVFDKVLGGWGFNTVF
ncbi:MAG: hypothetical protein DMG06_01170, partial [Acidobacteria bacterium]